MKKLFLILVISGLASVGAAQSRTAGYMKKIPALSKDSCQITKPDADAYEEMVNSLSQQLRDEIDALNDRLNQHVESNKSAAQERTMKQMSQMYGVSQSDLESMKNAKNMSAAEKQAFANKIMQQQTNMTMEDAQNLGKMNEAEKKAYSEAYAAEAMANRRVDPNQKAKNEQAASMYKTVTSQQAANSRISEINEKIASLYIPIENDPERTQMLGKIDGLHRKVISMSGIVTDRQSRQIDSLNLLIRKEEIAYCNKFSPRYRAALRKHLTILKSSLPDFQAMGNITAEALKTQTGIEMPEEAREIPALEAVQSYLQALSGSFKYNLYYRE